MIVRNYHINKDRVSDIWDDCERLQQSGEYVLANMLPEPSNYDDTVHFKNDPLGLQIFPQRITVNVILFSIARKKSLEERSRSLNPR